MQNVLNSILVSGDIPADLEIAYDDRHGLWGGTELAVTGRGSSSGCHERTGADPMPEIFAGRIAREQMLELIGLLIELKAWEQQTEDRPPVADESRATLTIIIGGQVSRIWERTHEMMRNGRLARVKAMMSEIVIRT